MSFLSLLSDRRKHFFIDLASYGGAQSGNGGAIPTQSPGAMDYDRWLLWCNHAREVEEAKKQTKGWQSSSTLHQLS